MLEDRSALCRRRKGDEMFVATARRGVRWSREVAVAERDISFNRDTDLEAYVFDHFTIRSKWNGV